MTTFAELQTAITDISQNHYIQTGSSVTLASRINQALQEIAGGIRMPEGSRYAGLLSPPLPDLIDMDTVATSTTEPQVGLPSDYQRGLFMVADSNGDQINAPMGGSYYSYHKFLSRIPQKDLTETGEVYICAVTGTYLYYQGIPSASVNLTVHFYRKPTTMSDNAHTPDGLPPHLQLRLIKHHVGLQLANEMVDGLPDKRNYHEIEFYRAMGDLIDFIGIDSEPEYYHSDYEGSWDAGVCD